MDMSIFAQFENGLSKYLTIAINDILQKGKGKKIYGIGFITTDDFYGFYITYDFWDESKGCNINEYCEWGESYHPKPDFLYQPLVDIVDASSIDFTVKSDEKWEFGKELLSVMAKYIEDIPCDIFTKNGYSREDVIFFATMSAGDYMSEMMNESLRIFNNINVLEKYGLTT